LRSQAEPGNRGTIRFSTWSRQIKKSVLRLCKWFPPGFAKPAPVGRMAAMQRDAKHPLITAARRPASAPWQPVLGMIRDMATASVLGMSGSAVARCLRNRLPAAEPLPPPVRRRGPHGQLPAGLHQHSKPTAGSLATGQRAFHVADRFFSAADGRGDLVFCCWVWPGAIRRPGAATKLSAVTLPYMLLICLAAQITATLQALRTFPCPPGADAAERLHDLRPRGSSPPHFPRQPRGAGVVLAARCWWAASAGRRAVAELAEGRSSFRLRRSPPRWTTLRHIGPPADADAVVWPSRRFNTFSDSIIAWIVRAHPGQSETISWLGGVHCPMRQGAAAALYYGERMYEFPLALWAWPWRRHLSAVEPSCRARRRQTARADRRLPCGWSFRWPARRRGPDRAPQRCATAFRAWAFHRGSTPPGGEHDRLVRAQRGAYCAAPVWCAVFTPSTTAARRFAWESGWVALDLTLGLTLIWPMAEAGLALSTAISAAMQLFLLLWLFARKYASLRWKDLIAASLRTIAASAVMAIVCYFALGWFQADQSLTINSSAWACRWFSGRWLISLPIASLAAGKFRCFGRVWKNKMRDSLSYGRGAGVRSD